jgi:tRNA(adenine34) deaminase
MSHDLFMEGALEQARRALAAGEVPIGAVLVMDEAIVARGFNQPIGASDPTAHAEVQVVRAAARIVGNYRLTGATVYVTVEPCLMCVGALIHARVGEVVFGAAEPKAGALVSAVRALETPGLNHRFSVVSGVLEEECREVIQQFFRARRSAARAPAPDQGDGETADNARIGGSERWPSG